MLQVVIPMAGVGSRFTSYGFNVNKYLLPVNIELESMIELAIVSLGITVPCRYFFIINESTGYDYDLRLILSQICSKNSFLYTIASVDQLTEGPASTVYHIHDLLDMSLPLLVSNSDQVLSWKFGDQDYRAYTGTEGPLMPGSLGLQPSKELYLVGRRPTGFGSFWDSCQGLDGCVLTYTPSYPLKLGDSDKHSFVRLDASSCVVEFAEKIVLSDRALVGVHYFSSGDVFVRAYQSMVALNLRAPNGEFYLSLCYEAMLRTQDISSGIQERSGQTMFDRISNNIPENDVGVCRNISNIVGIYDLNVSEGEAFYPVGEPDDYFRYLYSVGGYSHTVRSLIEYQGGEGSNTVFFDSSFVSISHMEVRGSLDTNSVIKNPGLILWLRGSGYDVEPMCITRRDVRISDMDLGGGNARYISIAMDVSGLVDNENVWFVDSFVRGWFIGDFEPSILRTKTWEMALLKHSKNEKWDFHYHAQADEVNVLLSGRMMLNGREIRSRNVFTIPKKQIACPLFLEDCMILCIKTPSVIGDKFCI